MSEGETLPEQITTNTQVVERRDREQVFEKIEQKLGIARQIWTTAQSLPIPSPSDSPQQIEEEGNKFHTIFQDALTSLPEGATKYQRLKEIRQITGEREQKAARMKRRPRYDPYIDSVLPLEQAKLEKDDDVRFLFSIENGIALMLKRREEIRGLVKKRGLGQEAIKNKTYDDLIPEEFTEYHRLKDVVASRFSINFIADRTAFMTYAMSRYQWNPRSGEPLPFYGFHILRTPFNYITDKEAIITEIFFGKDSPEYLEEERFHKEAIEHEEFHSFFEGFHAEELPISYFAKSIPDRIKRIKRLQEIGAPPPIIENAKRDFISSLKQLQDLGQEELLAELASQEDKKGIPRRTFSSEMYKKDKTIEPLTGMLPEIDEILKKTRLGLDIDSLGSVNSCV